MQLVNTNVGGAGRWGMAGGQQTFRWARPSPRNAPDPVPWARVFLQPFGVGGKQAWRGRGRGKGVSKHKTANKMFVFFFLFRD